ncbi:MAG: zinc-binding dehydrogenase [Burkholderiaceae bacterium]
MKAIRALPGPDGGTVAIQELPTPAPGPGQVLIKVQAAGLNRGEIKQARELRSGSAVTMGVECAGEVAAVGEGVSAWRPGDRVMGHGRGCQADYAVLDERALMAVPDRLSWTDAAAFPNVYITAHDAVVTNAHLRAGESVLINGAAGGVSMAAIQIAKLIGATPIIGTSRSAAKLEKLSRYGLDVGIDVSQGSQVDLVTRATEGRGVDVIIDTVGASVFEENIQSLAVKGRLIHIARFGSPIASLDLTQLWLKRLQLIGVTFRTRTEAERLACIQSCAQDLLPALSRGDIELLVDRTFPMSDIAAAHAYMLDDRHVGKIVLTAG